MRYLRIIRLWSLATRVACLSLQPGLSQRQVQSCASEDVYCCSSTLQAGAVAASLLDSLGLSALDNVSVSLGCKWSSRPI